MFPGGSRILCMVSIHVSWVTLPDGSRILSAWSFDKNGSWVRSVLCRPCIPVHHSERQVRRNYYRRSTVYHELPYYRGASLNRVNCLGCKMVKSYSSNAKSPTDSNDNRGTWQFLAEKTFPVAGGSLTEDLYPIRRMP